MPFFSALCPRGRMTWLPTSTSRKLGRPRSARRPARLPLRLTPRGRNRLHRLQCRCSSISTRTWGLTSPEGTHFRLIWLSNSSIAGVHLTVLALLTGSGWQLPGCRPDSFPRESGPKAARLLPCRLLPSPGRRLYERCSPPAPGSGFRSGAGDFLRGPHRQYSPSNG